MVSSLAQAEAMKRREGRLIFNRLNTGNISLFPFRCQERFFSLLEFILRILERGNRPYATGRGDSQACYTVGRLPRRGDSTALTGFNP